MPPKPPPRILRKPPIPLKPPQPRAASPLKPHSNPQPTTQPTATPHASQSQSRPPKGFSSRLPIWLLPTVSMTLTLAGAGLIFRDMIICFDTVNGISMAPTLSPHAHDRGERDEVMIQRPNYPWLRIQRGDIVTFWAPHNPNSISIKRVIALEGDIVFPKRGYASGKEKEKVSGPRVGIGRTDGLPSLEDLELFEGRDDGRRTGEGRVVVPHGHIWVEGDNSGKTYDSRDFGPISMNLVDGKAVRVWKGWLGGLYVPIEDQRGKKDRKAGSRVQQVEDRGEGVPDWAEM